MQHFRIDSRFLRSLVEGEEVKSDLHRGFVLAASQIIKIFNHILLLAGMMMELLLTLFHSSIAWNRQSRQQVESR